MIHLLRSQVRKDNIFAILPFAIMLPTYLCIIEWGIFPVSNTLFSFSKYLIFLPILITVFFNFARAKSFHGAWDVTFSLHTTFTLFILYTSYFSVVQFYQDHGFYNRWPQYWIASVILLFSIIAGYFNINSIKAP